MGTVRFKNDHIAAITRYGDYVQGNLTICHVYYVEDLGHKLFLVGQFCDEDLEVAFHSNTCYVRNLEGYDLLTSSREFNLYTISISVLAASSLVCLMSKATSTKSWLWHRRLSHLNFGTINQLMSKDLVDGLPKLKYNKDHLCSACKQGKSKKASFPSKLVPSIESKLELLHMDLCGLMRVESIDGKKYILMIVDDYSSYTWNRSLVHTRYNKTPYELIRGRKPNVQYFHVFGSLCYLTNDRDDLGKMKPKADTDSDAPQIVTSLDEPITQQSSIPILETHSGEQIQEDVAELDTLLYTLGPGLNCSNFQDSSKEMNEIPSQQDLDNLFGSLHEEYYAPNSDAPQIVTSLDEPITQQSSIPDGFIDLYGLKQAPRAWYDKLSSFLVEHHFTKGIVDPTLFTQRHGEDILLVQIYVDDIIFGSTNPVFSNRFAKLMKDNFEMSMMGEMKFFLGLQIHQSPRGIFINQSQYTMKLLRKHEMKKCDIVTTPMAIAKIDEDLHGTPTDQTKYRSMIRGLMYLTTSRPDIAFATFVCARYQARRTEKHLKEVKRIFRYLRKSINKGLWYSNDSRFELIAYSDADLAGCLDDYKSTSEGIQFLGDKLVSWSSKKKDCTTMLTVKAEYEHVEKGTIELYFAGTDYQLADLFTKALPRERFEYLVHMIVSKVPDTEDTIMFKLDRQEIIYTVDMFYDTLHLPVETQDNPLIALVNIRIIESFMQRVGYQGVVDKVSTFYTKFLTQPWQTMFKVFNRCLTTRTSGHDQTKINILQLFQKKNFIWYPHTTKLIIADLMKKFPSIPQRLDEDYHSIKDDIPLTDEIGATDDYKEYETVYVGVKVPMNQPQPVVSTQGTYRTTPRAHRTPTLTAVSPRGKKRKQSARETSSPRKSLKVTIKQKQVVEGEKDAESYASKFAAFMLDDNVDDSGNRLEPGSYKENPKVVKDYDKNEKEKKDEKKDDDRTHEIEETLIDEDEVIPEDETPELITEFQNVDKRVLTIFDRARMKATLNDMLSNQFKNAEEYAYHLEQATNFMKNQIVWESRQEDIKRSIPKAHIFYGPQRNPNEPPRYLYNKDLFFLKNGNIEEKKYILSLYKIHAELFPEADLEEKMNHWVQKEFKNFNEDARLSIQHWKDSWHKRVYKQNQRKVRDNPGDYVSNHRITKVVRITTDQLYALDFMEQIIVMRENDKPDSFSEADFKYLNKNDIEDLYYLCRNKKERVHDFHLGIESYQIKVNLTAPTLTFFGIEAHKPHSIVDNPNTSLIYLNTKDEKQVMYLVEIVKFCDATLERVLNEVKLRIFQNQFWKKPPRLGELDLDIMKAFEREITKRLRHREQMRRMTKVIKEEFDKIKDVKVKYVSLTCDTSLEVFNNEVSRLSGMDDDLFTYEVEVANILCHSNMDDDSEHEADDDMGYDLSNVAFTEWLGLKFFNYKIMDHYTIKALWIY
ncbi:retrovirus-related pol polyprotein from transposon TNT 1-94 [Tanacetum coccineum]